MFQKELVWIRQAHQKNESSVTIAFFKDIGFTFEENVYNGCHHLFMMADSLKDIEILRAKGATLRCLMMGISKNQALKQLNNSVLEDEGTLYMEVKATQINIIN